MNKLNFIASIAIIGTLIGCSRTDSTNVLIDYQRNGGFTGIMDHLLIEKDGKAIVTRKDSSYELILDNSTIAELEQLLEEADFTSLENEYLSDQQGADFIEYQLTYRSHTVRAVDVTVPDRLWPALEALNQIIEGGDEQQDQ